MDENTISNFRDGNKEAFELLFGSLYPVMCLFATKIISDCDDAEDVAQEVFIELWHQRAKFESFDQIKAFLYISIKNRCLNFKKHQKVKEKFEKFTIATESEIDEYIIESEVVNNLSDAISNLPEQQKQVIILNMQGLKNEEIAQVMQISINTVKLYKKNAYQQIRTKVNPSLFLLLL